MEQLRDKALNAAIMHGSVLGTRAIFELVRLFDKRFKRAIDTFEATYQFRTGASARRLVFSSGRLRTPRGTVPSPDYELVFLDPPGVFRHMLKDSNDVLRLLLENKIDQKGNNYYLFRYGYLWGLCNRFFRETLENLGLSTAPKGIGDTCNSGND